MALNPRTLGLAQADLADIREKNTEELSARTRRVYSKVPEIQTIDNTLRSQMVVLAKLVFSKGSEDDIRKLKDDNLSLQARRAELLVENGFSRDYLDEIVSCPVCRDSGTRDGKICDCLLRLYNARLTSELSVLLRHGDECFDNFDLSLYPEESRDHMATVLGLAKEYAEFFPDVENLLLLGAPGLGKTYLSACIAREVASRGYSVFYASAIDVFTDFDDAQFRSDEAAAERCARCLDCDLLILDDLGTELLLPSVVTSLYSIINTRVNSGRGMIMNTNMTKDDVLERYSAAIGSRINGYFTILDFVGSDIRGKALSEQ